MTECDVAIDPDVGDFIAHYIDTVPHLEGLLLLWKSAPTRWTEAEIAARIYVAPETARRVVRDLAQHRLITAYRDFESYSINPQSDAMAVLPALARAYCTNLVAVTRLIHSRR